MSEDEEFWERDPSWTFILPNEQELFFIKKLLISERKAWTMGVFIDDFLFYKNDLNFVISQLHFLTNNGFIKIHDINYEGFCTIVENYNFLQGVHHDTILKNDDDYSDIVFRYEIIRKKALTGLLNEKISQFQSDIIYNELGEPFSKHSPDIKKLNNITLPFQQQTEETLKVLKQHKNSFFQLILEQQKQINMFAVLLSLENDDIIQIIDIYADKEWKVKIDIAIKKELTSLSVEKGEIHDEKIQSGPYIQRKSIELISRDIGELDSGSNLIDFLIDCGVDKKLIEYPNTKWRMINSVLLYLSSSKEIDDYKTLCTIIERACHPLTHNGDKDRATKYRNRFNNLLEYDNFTIENGKLKKINNQPDDTECDDVENVFNYDGGISTPYENTELELFILKKILIEHKRRDDAGFYAKELSFNYNTLKEICLVVNRLMEDKILYLSANTKPENFGNKDGIRDDNGFINWKLVERLDENIRTMDLEENIVIFDMEIIDEIKLKNRIDLKIDEFRNDKIYNPLGYLIDKCEIDEILTTINKETDKEKREFMEKYSKPENTSYPYLKQREIVVNEIEKNNMEEMIFSLNNFWDKQVELLKVLLALEKENLLRIIKIDGNPIYNKNNEFVGQWSTKDNPTVKIRIIKMSKNTPEPLHIIIDDIKKEIGVRGFQEKAVLQKPKNKRIQLIDFPVEFDDDRAILTIGGQKCQLPPFKNEHYLCEAIFQYKKNEPVDWECIYEKMQDVSVKKIVSGKEHWRTVYDTVGAINKRIQECANTEDNWLSWSEKTVKRKY